MGLILLKDLGIVFASFLVGAVPFCYILGRVVGRKKLTEIGDKNPGGWNLVFNVSKIWGFIGILLDMAKGYFAYLLATMFAGPVGVQFLGAPYAQVLGVTAGCAAVLGHNYSPYMKFKGGKGVATWGGFMIAIHPLNLLIGAAGLLTGLLVARNMIWSIGLGILFTGIFSWIIHDTLIFWIIMPVLFIIMIPKQINHSISMGLNFKFRKEASLGDLFKPKIR